MRLWDGNGQPFSLVPRHRSSLHDSTGGSVVGVIIIALGFNLPSRFVEQIMRLWDGNGPPFSLVPRHRSSLHDSTGGFCGRGHNHCSQIYLEI